MDLAGLFSTIWGNLFPDSYIRFGVQVIALSVLAIMIDPPGGVPWDKVGAVCSTIGGFAIVGGGSGGAVAQAAGRAAQAVESGVNSVAQATLGAGIGFILFVGAGLYIYTRVKGKGTNAGSKAKSLGIAFVLVVMGGLVAAGVPALFQFFTDIYGTIAGVA